MAITIDIGKGDVPSGMKTKIREQLKFSNFLDLETDISTDQSFIDNHISGASNLHSASKIQTSQIIDEIEIYSTLSETIEQFYTHIDLTLSAHDADSIALSSNLSDYDFDNVESLLPSLYNQFKNIDRQILYEHFKLFSNVDHDAKTIGYETDLSSYYPMGPIGSKIPEPPDSNVDSVLNDLLTVYTELYNHDVLNDANKDEAISLIDYYTSIISRIKDLKNDADSKFVSLDNAFPPDGFQTENTQLIANVLKPAQDHYEDMLFDFNVVDANDLYDSVYETYPSSDWQISNQYVIRFEKSDVNDDWPRLKALYENEVGHISSGGSVVIQFAAGNFNFPNGMPLSELDVGSGTIILAGDNTVPSYAQGAPADRELIIRTPKYNQPWNTESGYLGTLKRNYGIILSTKDLNFKKASIQFNLDWKDNTNFNANSDWWWARDDFWWKYGQHPDFKDYIITYIKEDIGKIEGKSQSYIEYQDWDYPRDSDRNKTPEYKTTYLGPMPYDEDNPADPIEYISGIKTTLNVGGSGITLDKQIVSKFLLTQFTISGEGICIKNGARLECIAPLYFDNVLYPFTALNNSNITLYPSTYSAAHFFTLYGEIECAFRASNNSQILIHDEKRITPQHDGKRISWAENAGVHTWDHGKSRHPLSDADDPWGKFYLYDEEYPQYIVYKHAIQNKRKANGDPLNWPGGLDPISAYRSEAFHYAHHAPTKMILIKTKQDINWPYYPDRKRNWEDYTELPAKNHTITGDGAWDNENAPDPSDQSYPRAISGSNNDNNNYQNACNDLNDLFVCSNNSSILCFGGLDIEQLSNQLPRPASAFSNDNPIFCQIGNAKYDKYPIRATNNSIIYVEQQFKGTAGEIKPALSDSGDPQPGFWEYEMTWPNTPSPVRSHALTENNSYIFISERNYIYKQKLNSDLIDLSVQDRQTIESLGWYFNDIYGIRDDSKTEEAISLTFNSQLSATKSI